MVKSQYIEDIFIDFYNRLTAAKATSSNDLRACHSFFNLIVDNKAFTIKQASYITVLMKKYIDLVCDENFNYLIELENPKFKLPFRIVDDNKKVWVEKSDDGVINLCCKFPYAFKGTFDKALEEFNKMSRWDTEKAARLVPFYNINLPVMYEFFKDKGFEMDHSFLHAMSESESAWDNIDDISPSSRILQNQVSLKSSNEYAVNHFEKFKTGNTIRDQFLAKTLGYPVILGKPAETAIEKIVTSKSNIFWIKDNESLLKIYTELNCKIAVILDRNDKNQPWVENFVKTSDFLGIPRSKIKVCFRTQSGTNDTFNSWIKESGLGGKVEEGDIFIFDQKPAKWIFKEKNFIKIAVSTSKYPPPNVITGDWFKSHPCAIHLSDIKPTVKGNTKLVNL
jgi:hypothetical protein